MPEVLGSFDNEKDAIEKLKEYKSYISYYPSDISYYDVTEYYIEEIEYDDEDPDEFVNDFGTCKYTDWDEWSHEEINSWK